MLDVYTAPTKYICLAVPYPTHPAPANLTMPDFSQRVGSGFGGGINITDAKVYLAVLEEWATGTVSISKIGIARVC